MPKQWRWMGWTLNFAHRSARLVLLAAFAIAVGPVLIIVAAADRPGAAAVLGAVALSVVVLCLGAAWESERRR